MVASLPLYPVFFATIAFCIFFPDVVLWLPKQVPPESVGLLQEPHRTSKQIDEFVDAEPRLPDDRAQCLRMELPVVVRDRDPEIPSTSVSKRVVTARDMVDEEISSLERPNHLPRLENRQPPLHEGASTTDTDSRIGSLSYCSLSGIGSPSLRRLSR